jgi:ribosomal protein S18 acetylase RimI-like enzyme
MKRENGMSLSIRPAETADAGTIADLIEELARDSGWESPVTEVYTAGYLVLSGQGVLLAEEDGRTRGLISYSMRPNLYHAAETCLIEELIVRRDARGRGIGRALVEALERLAAARRCAEISVSTLPRNEAAIRFYRRLGFTDEALYLEKHLED